MNDFAKRNFVRVRTALRGHTRRVSAAAREADLRKFP
jgi:hypothetical protein